MPELSFEAFVGETLPALSRYAYALTGGTHPGEELVQDTLVKLAGVWHRVRRDGNPVGYARTVMFRTYISSWRALRRRPASEPYEEQPSADDPYETVDARDSLRRALRELPRMQRAVLVLTYLDDLPDESIAELLGRRPATVRSLRHRGLRAMREHMARTGVAAEAGTLAEGDATAGGDRVAGAGRRGAATARTTGRQRTTGVDGVEVNRADA